MSLGNPIEAWMQMAQAKNNNRNQMNQDIAGIGQGVGQSFNSIGSYMQEQKKKQLLAQIVQAMNTQGAPQQGPPLAPQGTPQPNMTQIPPGQPMSAGSNIGQDVQMPQPIPTQGPGQPTSGMGGPAQDNTDLLKRLMMQADPQGMMAGMEKQMFANPQKPTSPWRVIPNMFTKDGKPIQQNEQTGEVRAVNLEAKASSPRASAMDARTKYLNKALDYRQRDLLTKGTNLPGQQLKTLTQNNMRADRALDLIGSPNVTWQKLNFAITDLGAIMQGGVPHKEQVLDAQFPSWKQKVAQYKTYATGQPTANVPEPIRQEVMGMIQSLKKVDNEYLTQNKENLMKMIGPTVNNFESLKPIIEQGTQKFMQGTQKPQGGPYSDPGKEARYQAWKKSQGQGL